MVVIVASGIVVSLGGTEVAIGGIVVMGAAVPDSIIGVVGCAVSVAGSDKVAAGVALASSVTVASGGVVGSRVPGAIGSMVGSRVGVVVGVIGSCKARWLYKAGAANIPAAIRNHPGSTA